MAKCLFSMSAIDVSEIYSPTRFTVACGIHGIGLGFAVDFTTQRPDGEYRDSSGEEDVEMLEKLQEKRRPRMLIGSPPCTDFSALLHLSKTEEGIEQRKEDAGRPHLRWAVQSPWRQLNIGNRFLHEHPKSASSWIIAVRSATSPGRTVRMRSVTAALPTPTELS